MATVVLILHGLLILIFLRADRGAESTHPQEGVHVRILYLLTLPRLGPRAPGVVRELTRRGRGNSGSRIVPAPVRVRPPPAPTISVPYGPAIDWQQAADEVARSLTSKHGTKVHPGSGEHPPTPYEDCEPQPQFAWDPEPKRVGLIDHWLPYLRLGNHCIVTLGMFGCVIGQLPAPNGHLFERAAAGSAKQNSTPTGRTWLDGEPRGLCRPAP